MQGAQSRTRHPVYNRKGRARAPGRRVAHARSGRNERNVEERESLISEGANFERTVARCRVAEKRQK